MYDVDTLAARVKSGDARAFETLYDRYANLVFGIALRMLEDPDAAEDVVQTVFLKFWNAPEAFRGGNYPAWIARTARNRSLDILRSRARADDPMTPPDVAVDHALDDVVIARIDGARVRRALDVIPSEQRIAIELGFFSGITHEEIARRIDAPLGTVKTRIRAGLLKLRRALGEDEESV